MRVTLAAELVDWAALGKVVGISLIAGAGVSAAFSFAILGATQFADARRSSRVGAALGYALVVGVCGAIVLGAMVVGIAFVVS